MPPNHATSPTSKKGTSPAMVQEVLDNPQLLEQITDRVYALFRQNAREHQERVAGYGPSRGLNP